MVPQRFGAKDPPALESNMNNTLNIEPRTYDLGGQWAFSGRSPVLHLPLFRLPFQKRVAPRSYGVIRVSTAAATGRGLITSWPLSFERLLHALSEPPLSLFAEPFFQRL